VSPHRAIRSGRAAVASVVGFGSAIFGSALRRRARGFPAQSQGIAALEFALILPFLLTAYFGTVETMRAIDNSRRFNLFARTIADLSGRTSVASMDTIFNASAAILQPFDTKDVAIVVSAMGVEAIGGQLFGGVCSSVATSNTVPRTRLDLTGTKGIPAVPLTFQFDGARYILAEVTMPYAPMVGSKIYRMIFGSTSLVFSQQVAWAERTDTEIVMPGGAKCPTY
jgi:Flp pilus assembly protein TadG